MISEKLWNWTSPVWLVVGVLLIGYLIVGRGRTQNQLAIYLLGLCVLVLSFVSPVGVLADGYLFSAHMVQHLVLLQVVPLCILLSLPRVKATKWFQSPRRDRVGRLLAMASIGWIAGVGAMWFWHVPLFCSAAAQRPSLGAVRDLSLVLAGFAFWWPIYAPCERYRLDPLRGIAYLFSACLGCTLLGIYITFAPLSVCPVFASPVDRIGILNSLYDAGLTPGIDQHLGGLMMWVPPCILYVGAIISLLCRWYSITDSTTEFVPGSAKSSGVSL
ncbi:cytochrome c oxidase assembly protein [Bythopirellula polymerisocia]|uniref:Cytochrome c oxidase caa3 assembly factor n=1 Tax=Bythopirellula polymerisocia TaxID=2528003 RepID=A0A5C6CW43_9BACT|nr:cytochrome c oxidase assembly protein [Bythopirellula polymerisocia]TWU28075.1 Cytochrome c oxidase caa3 assembly factor [Bythopirellula polymerisocia]